MKLAFCFITLVIISAFVYSAPVSGDTTGVRNLRELHLRVKNGEQLTPEEQASYERGKAARQANGAASKRGPGTAPSADANPSTGLIPLCDMTEADRYKGEDGGLYGGGSNIPPQPHLAAALELAAQIQPLDADGTPSPDGKIVLLTHGISNTTMASTRFIEMANADPRRNPAVLLIDGAQGGIDSRGWEHDRPTRRGTSPWDSLEKRIKSAGATPQQVQVVWMKHAVARAGQFGDFPKHAVQLKSDTTKILHMLKERYPNLKIAYLSSRSYGGYSGSNLNPEPYV